MKLALRYYEQSLCSCGHSSYLAHGPEGVGEYETHTITCHSCKAKEREKPGEAPGVKLFTVDLHDDPHDDEPDEDGDDDG